MTRTYQYISKQTKKTATSEELQTIINAKESANSACNIADANLKAFISQNNGIDAMGLVKDEVRNSEQYKALKTTFNSTFTYLQNLNAQITKQYKIKVFYQ